MEISKSFSYVHTLSSILFLTLFVAKLNTLSSLKRDPDEKLKFVTNCGESDSIRQRFRSCVLFIENSNVWINIGSILEELNKLKDPFIITWRPYKYAIHFSTLWTLAFSIVALANWKLTKICVFQIISLESILELGRSGERSRHGDEIRALALSVFTQCRRSLSHSSNVKALTGFGTAAMTDLFLKNKDVSSHYDTYLRILLFRVSLVYTSFYVYLCLASGEKSSCLQGVLSTLYPVEKSRETAKQWWEFGLWRIQFTKQYSIDGPAVFHSVRCVLLVRRSKVDSRISYRRTGFNIGNVYH